MKMQRVFNVIIFVLLAIISIKAVFILTQYIDNFMTNKNNTEVTTELSKLCTNTDNICE